MEVKAGPGQTTGNGPPDAYTKYRTSPDLIKESANLHSYILLKQNGKVWPRY